MKKIYKIIFLSALLLLMSQAVVSDDEKIQLFMADGQLKSHPLRLFITKDIDAAMLPKLLLTGSHAITKKSKGEDRLIEPMLIARNQKSEQTVNDIKITLTGTLFLFDLSYYPIPPYKTVMRLTPTLIWQEGGSSESRQVAIGEHEIYLANPVPAFILPFAIVMFLVLMIVFMAKRGNKSAVQFICNKEGFLSLSRTQVASWTVVIGGMITAYGLMRLQVPQIPASLVALMGLSLATGGISYAQSAEGKENAPNLLKSELPHSISERHKTSVADLVMDHKMDAKNSLSIARAQMVFWTALTLILFVVKSILDGNLWAVPWELVALMGLSQVGYLAPKINFKVDGG